MAPAQHSTKSMTCGKMWEIGKGMQENAWRKGGKMKQFDLSRDMAKGSRGIVGVGRLVFLGKTIINKCTSWSND